MSHAYRHDLNWLISDFTARVADVAHAAVVSADGVPLALSDDIPDDFGEQLAAITSGLASLVAGAARIFEAGLPVQALCEMDGGLMIIKAVSDGSSLCVLAVPTVTPRSSPTRCRGWSKRSERCCRPPSGAAASP